MPTEFIVKVDTYPRKVVVAFVTAIKDVVFVGRWREALGVTPEQIQREAVDLAELARERYVADSNVGQPYIATPEDLRKHTACDPQSEVAGLVVLKCDWLPQSDVIGLCHFRRTWCNNIVLDYLASHPLTLGHSDDPRHRVKGIGSALLCFLSRLAMENSCDYLWGEATQSSCTFYMRLFKVKDVRDVFMIPRDNFIKCAELNLDWQSKADANKITLEAMKELYDVEESHPPLVGNRSIMAGSRRQLVNHFLDLPRHDQNEIAQALGLLREGDSDILENQWCGILFQRAAQSGKLYDLWNEVENRHEKGEPEKNPFPR
jgi:hypothetical protein